MYKLRNILVLFVLIVASQNTTWAQITTFNYTGDVQTFLVPAGVTSIQIEALGAQGGGLYGGLGGYAMATLPVVPGSTLQIYVGGNPTVQLGTGGFNGGGSIGALPCGGPSDGWPGGGASDVRTSASLNSRLIVAGGGGGQGWSDGLGGAGGGLTGVDGEASWITDTQGLAATQVAGGIAGDYEGEFAWNGVFGDGGDAGPLGGYCIGGAGGGGYFGGGGGYVSAGGGGSSYIGFSGTVDAVTESGVQTGHGQILITLLCTLIEVTPFNNFLCEGDELTLNASGIGDISWDNGVVNGEIFIPSVGTTTYTATSTNTDECSFSVEIEVYELPMVTAFVSDSEICEGDSILFTGSGNYDEFSWSPIVIAPDEYYFPSVGTTTYTLFGTNETGCGSSSEVTVTVYEQISITSIISDELIGGDGAIDITISGGNPDYIFDWDNDELDDFDDLEDLMNLSSGTYTVVVQGEAGCTASETFEIDNLVGISEIDNSIVTLFPNPATSQITIDSPGSFDFKIINLIGETVLKGSGSDSETVSLDKIPIGTYFINIMIDEGIQTVKFIKE